jgi:(p)ppGpp synthase/HD superfamily hydrolase
LPRKSWKSATPPHDEQPFTLQRSSAVPNVLTVLRQYELLEKVRAYDPDADEAMINRAYVFSMKAHGSQKRASGDPYYSHPIEVAGILTDLHLDDETIVTAILHDTIEDTVATPEEVEKLFGKNVARLVDGVTEAFEDRGAERESARAEICANSCSPCPATSACCW